MKTLTINNFVSGCFFYAVSGFIVPVGITMIAAFSEIPVRIL